MTSGYNSICSSDMGHRTQCRLGTAEAATEVAEKKTVSGKQSGFSLREASVGPLTKKKYEAMWEQFQTWCGTRLRATMNKSRLDILLTEYLEFLYLEGEDLSKANYVAAVLYKVPGTKGSHSLPKTQQSMKGWRRLCPPRHECPCHRSCVPTGDGCFATAPDSDCP